ncbi:hypothetical protein LOAG_17938 [Loa loa]|uniref:Uncharacterized protein n=1 Tax=Loa loa TaxID=7209 RepID=A0A1S0UGV4_LOALO|nr:hypothetical protein LOAG_17938 [Loa loa]EJD74805.1 hypothetical protein LOAG_17938 [Loa loa]
MESHSKTSRGLISKFEIERINAELELVSHHHDTINLISHQQEDDSIWEEITKEGQQLANQLLKELDQVEDSIQEKLKNIVNHWKLLTICIDILVISIVLIKLKFELFKSLFCLTRRQNSRSKNIIILPTNLVETIH